MDGLRWPVASSRGDYTQSVRGQAVHFFCQLVATVIATGKVWKLVGIAEAHMRRTHDAPGEHAENAWCPQACAPRHDRPGICAPGMCAPACAPPTLLDFQPHCYNYSNPWATGRPELGMMPFLTAGNWKFAFPVLGVNLFMSNI
jgi:hypothetical protein